MCAGVLTNQFVQLNWTGPPVSLGEWLAPMVGGSAVLSRMNKESLEGLSWDGEVCAVTSGTVVRDLRYNNLPVIELALIKFIVPRKSA